MSNCYFCARREPFNTGQNTQDGWLCSRCSSINEINIAVGVAPIVIHHSGAHLVGVLGGLTYSDAERNALISVVNGPQHDSIDEDIWGVGFAARHQTIPGANVVIVFTRVGGVVSVYGIGGHTGRGNGHYRIVRWNGRSYRVVR